MEADKTTYSDVKLVVLSVDGVFTDGTCAYDYTGSVIHKSFLNKDFDALSELSKVFNIIILSSFNDINYNVFSNKGFKFYCSKNKNKLLKRLLNSRGLSPDNCVYVGSDLLDLPCVRLIPLSFCPKDAFVKVKDLSTILPVKGGEGVIYSLYDFLLPEITLRYKFYK